MILLMSNFLVIMSVLMSMLIACQYYINSYGILLFLEKNGIEKSWYAFIPFYRHYLMGKVMEKELTEHPDFVADWYYGFGWIASYLPVSLLNVFFYLAHYIYVVVCNYELGKKYKNGILALICSIFKFEGIAYFVCLKEDEKLMYGKVKEDKFEEVKEDAKETTVKEDVEVKAEEILDTTKEDEFVETFVTTEEAAESVEDEALDFSKEEVSESADEESAVDIFVPVEDTAEPVIEVESDKIEE